MALNDLHKNVFCSCFMNTAHWAENCILVSSFSFEHFLRLIKTQEMCVFVWSGLSWKVWSTVRWAPLQTWSPFTESQNEKQSLGLRTHSCSLNKQIFPESRRENDGIKMRSTCWKERERHCLFSNTRETKAVSDIDGSMETKKAFFKVFQTIMSL